MGQEIKITLIHVVYTYNQTAIHMHVRTHTHTYTSMGKYKSLVHIFKCQDLVPGSDRVHTKGFNRPNYNLDV